MAIGRRDILQILRDENELLKTRNQQIGNKLARQQQAFRVLAAMIDKSQRLCADQELPAVLNELLADVLHVSNTENGSLLLIDEAAQELEFVAVVGEAHDHLLNHRLRLDTGLVGEVIASGESALIEDVHNSSRWSSSVDQRLDFNTSSLMCVPIIVSNHVVGAIEVVNHMGDTPFDNNDLNILRVAGHLVSQALECIETRMLRTGVTDV